MICKIKKYGAGGLCIHLKKSDGFEEGGEIEIHKPNEKEGLTEKRVREIFQEEFDKARNY